jgi:DNA-directed RNA polymerase specialized sigma24 family protein
MMRLVERKAAVRNPLPWLFVVTRRVAVKRRRDDHLSFVDPTSPTLQRVPLVHDERPSFAAVAHALRKVSSLTVKDRHVLALVAAGYTHAEIAARLLCRRRDVGQYVSRAMKRLNHARVIRCVRNASNP